MTALQKQKRALEGKIKATRKEDSDKLSATSQEILALFAQDSKLSMSSIVKRTGKNTETVRKAVQSLVKKGYLKKIGSTRGVMYTKE